MGGGVVVADVGIEAELDVAAALLGGTGLGQPLVADARSDGEVLVDGGVLDELDAVAARFDSAERRPAFSLRADVNQSLTNREFGLHLKVAVLPAGGERVELNWTGSFSWAPGLIDQWAGEKYLLFGMKVAAFLKPGAVYQEGDEDEEAAPRGVNLGGLFKRKPKETNVVAVASEISFLVAERQEVPLKGRHLVQPGELVVSLFPIGDDPKQPGFICLFQQFTWDN